MINETPIRILRLSLLLGGRVGLTKGVGVAVAGVEVKLAVAGRGKLVKGGNTVSLAIGSIGIGQGGNIPPTGVPGGIPLMGRGNLVVESSSII